MLSCSRENQWNCWFIVCKTNNKITHRQGVLPNLTAGQSHDVRRVEPLVHGGALTGVDDEEQLVVPKHTQNNYTHFQIKSEGTQLAFPICSNKPVFTQTLWPSFALQLPRRPSQSNSSIQQHSYTFSHPCFYFLLYEWILKQYFYLVYTVVKNSNPRSLSEVGLGTVIKRCF